MLRNWPFVVTFVNTDAPGSGEPGNPLFQCQPIENIFRISTTIIITSADKEYIIHKLINNDLIIGVNLY